MEGSTGSLLLDFLSFRVLMTPAILVVVYYFGAIIVPLVMFWFVYKARQVIPDAGAPARRGRLRESIVSDNRSLLFIAGMVIFILLEVFWRMMFEFFIAYFQIHNALMGMG